ncbi:hypothetical protein QBC44DRAFT_359212 [Cladorrhinum sp. PSN332]|nr:hypothetical protein QBC44DRAFT_359212 [Cladorrhinum sp. PSN332]
MSQSRPAWHLPDRLVQSMNLHQLASYAAECAILQIHQLGEESGSDPTEQPWQLPHKEGRYLSISHASGLWRYCPGHMLYLSPGEPKWVHVFVPVCPWIPEPSCVHCAEIPSPVGYLCGWHSYYAHAGGQSLGGIELMAVRGLQDQGIFLTSNRHLLLEFVSLVRVRLHALATLNAKSVPGENEGEKKKKKESYRKEWGVIGDGRPGPSREEKAEETKKEKKNE